MKGQSKHKLQTEYLFFKAKSKNIEEYLQGYLQDYRN